MTGIKWFLESMGIGMVGDSGAAMKELLGRGNEN
jgi:hypothetical protein